MTSDEEDGLTTDAFLLHVRCVIAVSSVICGRTCPVWSQYYCQSSEVCSCKFLYQKSYNISHISAALRQSDTESPRFRRNNPSFLFPTSRSQKLASPWFWRQNVTVAKHKFMILTHFVKRDNLPRWKPLYDFWIWNEIFRSKTCDFNLTITSTHTYIRTDRCTICKVRIVCSWSRPVKTSD